MAVRAPRRPASMDFQLVHFVSEASEKMLIREYLYRVQTGAKYEKWESKTINYTQTEEELQPLVWEHAFHRGWL